MTAKVQGDGSGGLGFYRPAWGGKEQDRTERVRKNNGKKHIKVKI